MFGHSFLSAVFPPKTDGLYHFQEFFRKTILLLPFKAVGGKRGRRLSLQMMSAMAVRAVSIFTHKKAASLPNRSEHRERR